MASEKVLFDTTKDGKDVAEFVITRPNGESFSVIEYGAAIHTLKVFDKEGKLDDVMLGFDTIEGYLGSGSGHGSIIGRTANRIKGGAFTIDGVDYQLPKNEGENNLHGGPGNFQNSFWTGKIVSKEDAQAFIDELKIKNDWTVETEGVLLSFLLADGVCGVPGNMDMKVLYTWATDGTLIITYRAVSDKKTIFAPTNHSYFNIDGQAAGRIGEQLLWIDSEQVTEKDMDNVPNGKYIDVAGTEFDFRTPCATEKVLVKTSSNPQLNCSKGADSNYVLKTTQDQVSLVASVESLKSGRKMEVLTNFPGVQLYCACNLDEDGKGGVHYHPYEAICLETQMFPDAIHHENFASAVIDKDEVKGFLCGYRFSVK
ncbi:MAG: galactose mutarotase [Clostridiales bacterium]|nr:galactose mutarotase [Clostridiales bacterium]